MRGLDHLKGKVAVITGGSRGIGRAIALMLADMGCHISFNYHQNKDAAAKVENEVKDKGVRCLAGCLDIRDFKAVKSWIEDIKEQMGGLDILINNAGIINDKALMLMSEDDWRSVIDTNLNGTFNVTRSCIVTFLKQKHGEIINVSSVSGIIGLPRQINYSASKGGINAFTKSLAKEVAEYGIRVNGVAPGFIETDMLGEFNEDKKAQIRALIPMGRFGSTEDVAHCVSFLLSEQAKYITGQIINVDGGLVMR